MVWRKYVKYCLLLSEKNLLHLCTSPHSDPWKNGTKEQSGDSAKIDVMKA